MHADFNTARILFELKRKKRSKKNRTSLSLPPVCVGGDIYSDQKFDYQLTKDEYPNIIQLTVFEPAGKLLGLEKDGNLQSFRIATFFIGSKPNQVNDITIREARNHTAFSLTVAKIAYCFAAAELGVETFNGDDIRDLLSGGRNDTYNFVGGILRDERLTKRFLHSLYIRRRGDFITVVVHLFASCGMSPYEVVVGTTRN